MQDTVGLKRKATKYIPKVLKEINFIIYGKLYLFTFQWVHKPKNYYTVWKPASYILAVIMSLNY